MQKLKFFKTVKATKEIVWKVQSRNGLSKIFKVNATKYYSFPHFYDFIIKEICKKIVSKSSSWFWRWAFLNWEWDFIWLRLNILVERTIWSTISKTIFEKLSWFKWKEQKEFSVSEIYCHSQKPYPREFSTCVCNNRKKMKQMLK